MKYNIVAAVVLALGLIGAAFLYGGRYYFIRLDRTHIVKADRWTGKVTAVTVKDEWDF